MTRNKMSRIKKMAITSLAIAIIMCLFVVGKLSNKTVLASGTEADVHYYNGGFWSTMLTNNDFKNQFTTAEYDGQTDTVHLTFDYRSASGDADAWGPANAIADEYCDWSSAKTIIIEIKNNSSKTIADFRMFFSGYMDMTKSKETHIATKGGGKYYLRSKDGKMTENTCGIYSSGGYNIPVNFDGELIIPVSDIEGFWGDEVSFACIKRINFKFSQGWSVGDLTLGKVGYTEEVYTATNAPVCKYVPMIQENANVYYYNGGFWNAMLSNNDFINQFATAEYDGQTDTVHLTFDYRSASGDADAWGPANAIADEYCNLSSANAIVVEIKNNSDTTIADFRMFFSGYTDTTKQTETHIATKGGGKYYLRSKDGKMTENTCGLYSSGGYNIPVNFDGELIIPVSEMEGFWGGEVSFACIKRINFKFSQGWSVGDLTLGKVGYTDGDYKAKSYTYFGSYNESNFKMRGASIRVGENVADGIRFAILVEKGIFDKLSATNVSFGAVVIPSNLINGKLTVNTATANVVEIALDKWTEEEIGGVTYMQATVCLYDIPTSEYGRLISATGYINIGGTYVYAKEISRSISSVAQEAYEDESVSNEIKTLLEKYLPNV